MKKLIGLATVLVFIAFVGFINGAKAQDTCWAAGDINGDGNALTVADVVLGYRIILCEGPATSNMYEVDFNGDCNVDTADMNVFLDVLDFGPSILPRYPVPTCCNPSLSIFPAAAKGDVNTDGGLTPADAVVMLSCAFTGAGENCSFCQTDLNCDFELSPADVVQELNYVFLGTPPAGCP